MGSYFLGIDVGTNESKGVLIDSDCNIVASAKEQHQLLNPKPGFFEHDAEAVWWGDFCRISKRLLAESGIQPTQIGCVGLSALGCDCVPVDAQGNALSNAILYGIDSRAHQEIEFLNNHYGDDVQKVFGHPLCSSDIAPKILWIKNNWPEIHEKAAKFLTGSSFLSAKLTGRFTIDKYLAEDFLPLYNLEQNSVDEEGCKLFCKPSQMAEIRAATDIAGHVTAKAAAETGLAEGTPVLVGTGDSGAEAVSTGVFQPGDIMVQLGSSCYFVYLANRLVQEQRLWPGTFIIPGVYSICAGTNTAGTLTRWLRDQLYPELMAAETEGGANAYAAMAQQAKAIAPGSNGLLCLPYFAGERSPLNDPFAKGMYCGLTLEHTRAHMYKAAIEGICHSIAQVIGILLENNLPVNKIMAVGGGVQNEVWLQCVADVLGRPVHTAKVTLGAAYGDALMAALAGGAVASWAQLAEKVTPARTVTPNAEAHAVYRQQAPLFARLYQNNKEIMHALG